MILTLMLLNYIHKTLEWINWINKLKNKGVASNSKV